MYPRSSRLTFAVALSSLRSSVQTELPPAPTPAPAPSPLYNRTRRAKHGTRDTCDVRKIKAIPKKMALYANIDIPIFSLLISAFYIIRPLSKGQTFPFSIGNTEA